MDIKETMYEEEFYELIRVILGKDDIEEDEIRLYLLDVDIFKLVKKVLSHLTIGVSAVNGDVFIGLADEKTHDLIWSQKALSQFLSTFILWMQQTDGKTITDITQGPWSRVIKSNGVDRFKVTLERING